MCHMTCSCLQKIMHLVELGWVPGAPWISLKSCHEWSEITHPSLVSHRSPFNDSRPSPFLTYRILFIWIWIFACGCFWWTKKVLHCNVRLLNPKCNANCIVTMFQKRPIHIISFGWFCVGSFWDRTTAVRGPPPRGPRSWGQTSGRRGWSPGQEKENLGQICNHYKQGAFLL